MITEMASTPGMFSTIVPIKGTFNQGRPSHGGNEAEIFMGEILNFRGREIVVND